MASITQPGITPPAPGQHKEEPEFRDEDDIPSQDKPGATDDPRSSEPERGERGR